MLDSLAKPLPIAPWQRKRALWHYPAAIIAGILALATLATLVQHEKGRRVYKKVVNEISSKMTGEMSESDLIAAFGCHRAFPTYEAPSRDEYTFRSHTHAHSKILVLQICTNPNTFVEFPLRTHEEYAERHGYSYLARRRPLPHDDYTSEMLQLDSYWDKVKILKEVVDAEMAKPISERQEWIFFTDSDTIVLNQEIPIEDILPPHDKAPHVQMVIGRDGWGVNAGVFFLRISPWAQQFVQDWLEQGSTMPSWNLPLREQTMLQLMLPLDEIVIIEKYWFNAWGKPDPHQANRGWGEAGPATFQAHFNGDAKQYLKDYKKFLSAPGFSDSWADGVKEAKEALQGIWADYYMKRHA